MGITSAAQQHRQSTGNHTAQQDAQQRSQVKQDQYTRHLADRPGLHSGNVNRQQAAATVLQFLTFLTSIQNTTSRGVESPFFREGHEDAPPEAGESTANAGGKPATPIMSAIKDVLVKAGDFIEQHDPLKFPGAEAGPVRKGGDVQMQYWQSRNITLPETVTNSDIKAPCRYVGEKIPFSDYLREFGQGLRYPATKISVNIQTMGYWYAKGRCPTQEEINDVAEVTLKIDAVGSMLVGLLPNSKPVVVMQNIVAPILTMIADDLDGKPTSREEQMNLVDQMTMMSRASVEQMTPEEQVAVGSESAPGAPRQKKYSIPEFHVKRGRTEVSLNLNGEMIRAPLTEVRGRFFVTLPRGTGPEGRQEVFFNHIHRRWDCSGGKGKFNRFSKNERRLAQKFGIDQHHVHDKTVGGPPYYAVRNPHVRFQPYIKAVEMYGRLVPCRIEPKSGRTFIYDAANPSGRAREIVFAEGEWHLKISSQKLGKIKSVMNAGTGKMLDVAVVRTKNGVEIWAQVNRDTGSFYGPKFKLNRQGELEQIGFQGPKIGEPQPKGGNNKGGTGTGVQPQGSLNSLTEIAMPGASFSGKIFQKNIAGSPYVQFFTDVGSQAAGSERLVVSAHGGYTDSDIVGPAVQLSAGTTYKMLTPHDTYLNDPTLGYVVNPPSDFKAYVTLNNVDGKTVVSEVNFNPQEYWPEAELPANYDSGDGINQLGKKGGLQNYRLWQFDEKPEEIGGVLIENRELAKNNKAPLTDVLAVDDTVVDIGNTYSVESTTSLLIKLDENGKLVNAHGERYKEIVFSHCRNHMPTGANIPMYEMRPLSGARPKRDLASEAPSDNILTFHTTRMSRNSVDEPFNVTVTLERFELRPVRLVSKSTAASTSGTV
jgi:hypothetical protein